MGCTATSLRGLTTGSQHVDHHRETALERHLARITANVNTEINIGAEVMKPWQCSDVSDTSVKQTPQTNEELRNRKIKRQLSESGPLIVFLFGYYTLSVLRTVWSSGPSSRKGRVIDDLQEGYDFRLISGEELIFSELPRKLSNVIELSNPRQIRKLIEDDPTYVTLDWLLLQLDRRIAAMTLTSGSDSGSARFLVDLVPNMRYLLRASSFSSPSVSISLAKFEQKFPIAFALNLSVCKDEKPKPKCSNETRENSASDEADHHRKMKREILYNESVHGFIEYFNASRTLEIVITDNMTPELIARGVMATIQTKLEINRCHTVNSITLFAFDIADIKNIDVAKHKMEVLEASELLMLNPDTSTETILKDLKERINDKTNDFFILKLDENLLAREDKKEICKKFPLVFVESTESDLSETKTRLSRYHEYSSPDNHTYLFADRLQPDICRRLLYTLMS